MSTLATPENMSEFRRLNPGRELADGHVEGSAEEGDYWSRPHDEPIKDSEGEPMVLAIAQVVYRDALTGEIIG